MFQRDFVGLGENQTRNFVAQHKLCFIATSSTRNHTRNFVAQHKLCFIDFVALPGIILATSLPGNHTRNFVARHKLGFIAISPL